MIVNCCEILNVDNIIHISYNKINKVNKNAFDCRMNGDVYES